MKNKVLPSHLIDADITQLTKLFFELEYNSEDSLYTQIMMAYYLNDTKKLKRLNDTVKASSFLNVFCLSRIAILENKNYEIENIDIYMSSPYIGDLYFAMALIAAQQGNHIQVKNNFLNAYNFYTKIGATKKALTAQMNTITAEGNIHLEKRLLANYIESVEKLIEHNSITSAANICVNIADEFHKVGAQRSAYLYNEKALKILKDQKNTLQYAQALTHLCESMFCLGQNINANKILDELHSYDFIEIKEATKAIENVYLYKKNTINEDHLTMAWKIRLEKKDPPALLGEVSDQLIHLLANGPSEFEEILQELYPNIDELDARNRLTTLVSRINKKVDGLIIFNQNSQHFTLSNNEKIVFATQESLSC
ncbi:hypothetical protein [Halobacteriovorax sp. DA5]|uniref:hypothetical protein n=1 Tax=Halobacteriovorax sp. DA5 TaxID=2067553 RepID=UPI000CD1B9C6|nr:hypothetical protein [Halobacteriovorax sp. DA5]POB14597.1 hypothetical protein C0Z22_05745 [Halobacteriovorax sp. DA5]